MTDTHKLVPVEPTEERMNAGMNTAARWGGVYATYNAMLSAAPTQEASGVLVDESKLPNACCYKHSCKCLLSTGGE